MGLPRITAGVLLGFIETWEKMIGLWEVPYTIVISRIEVGDRIRGPLGDIDPLNRVPFQRARSRVQKGPL